MEYIYAAMILHSADKDINEENVKSIIEAAGIEADDARIKALIAALEDVDIDEAMETTAMAAAPAAAAPAAAGQFGGQRCFGYQIHRRPVRRVLLRRGRRL